MLAKTSPILAVVVMAVAATGCSRSGSPREEYQTIAAAAETASTGVQAGYQTPAPSHGDRLEHGDASGSQGGDDSGIYGFVGGGGGAPPGQSITIKGPCVTVLDPDSQATVATGVCDEHGKFRVALAPGRYVITAVGQRRTVEVKQGAWVASSFLLMMP